MKICSLYGFIIALGDALLILALFFLGFHSDPMKFTAAKWIGGLGGLAIGITVTVLGVKARRSETPANEGFGYGRALGAGFLISVVATVLSTLFTYAYNAFINPSFTELMVQDAMDKIQAKGISGAQADNMEKGMRFMMSPVMQSAFGLFAGLFFGLILALIIAAFLKRPAQAVPPSRRKEKGPGLLRALEFGICEAVLAAEQRLPVNAVLQRHDGADPSHAGVACDKGVRIDGAFRKQQRGRGDDRRGDRI